MFIIVEVNGQLHVLAALPLKNSPQYPLERKLVAPQSSYERRDKYILPLSETES
jgi:hypothetical protein